ncbi:heat shock protein [Mesocricetibacter intestinalis]|uniref:Protease HtpX n=1 Tax=Mesocricetibacter intestinalis TaxID=1521930 RepID=A0A4R6VH54_9PAST|nr:protease HtpX [Mesocricetibacter intestinalis]TDQ57429.1 heat shock protein [Mesocricetibacter intestinalis]
MMRILLFLATNMAVLVVFNIILSLTGIQAQQTGGLLIMAALFGFTGSIISLLLSKSMALRSVGAQVINQPRNATEQWLLNTVHSQAERAGLPYPEVAIYESEDVNAFATGPSKNNSLVAVSTALLHKMTRDEAEAVLAHEVSHIKNGDMVTMTLLQGVLNTFVIFISRLIAQVVSARQNDEESSGSSGTYFLVSMVLEVVFGFLASIIAMWFSRYREFRADAGSASLVGKQKMIAALQRLQSLHEPQHTEGQLAAFAINGKRGGLASLFMSHPPLEKRIEALKNADSLK